MTKKFDAIPESDEIQPEHYLAVRRDGLAFMDCLNAAAGNDELVQQYDRLRHTNLSRKGSGLALMIDDATGRTNHDVAGFIKFVWNDIFLRC